jgi:uncharacterized protein YeaO (DUF488 family)
LAERNEDARQKPAGKQLKELGMPGQKLRGEVKTKRWNDPIEADDGYRLLVCRFRPRALRKENETWNGWDRELGPSRKLLADFQGKNGPPLPWHEFRSRYLEEMASQQDRIGALAQRVSNGETVTLLCSKSCTDVSRCHRSLLKELIDKQLLQG